MTELANLVGARRLDAVDFDNEKIKQWYGDGYEDCTVCRFRLDGVVYIAIEDPDDGYRSSMRTLMVANDATMKNVFPAVDVVGRMRTQGEYGTVDDVLELVDAVTNKVVLEVGTDNCDDYYPCFVASFHPEAMATNADVLAAEEKKAKAADGWVEWTGGEQPVESGTHVEIRANFTDAELSGPAEKWAWDHNRPHVDQIIAYRVVGAA